MLNANESVPAETPAQTTDHRVSVVTGSRLHFGLLSASASAGVKYGGCGLMLHRPSVCVRVRPCRSFEIRGEFQTRCADIAQSLVGYFNLAELPKCILELVRCPGAHTGLGSGTQINLAVAQALASYCGLSIDLPTLASEIADRGRRSAVGVHGFARGGFIAETGVTEKQALGTLHQAVSFPVDWRILLVRPERLEDTVHGELEQTHFSRLAGPRTNVRESLHEIMIDEVLPAVVNQEFAPFCDSVSRFNHASGMMFAEVQGGAYNGPQLESTVEFLRAMGCQGIGQSSWGPTIFAFTESQSTAESLRIELLENQGDRRLQIAITRARNKPASVCGP